MPKLTPEGERLISGIAERYAVSIDAIKSMLDAVQRGGGTMAQFNVPELGGGGQWMMGGMTMVGDMFNNSLKATVDNLCYELSTLLANQQGFLAPAAQFQSQTQSGSGAFGEGVSLFVPQASSGWWPSELGHPSSTGSQNNLRYAYFPGQNRLAIDYGGRIETYDTTGYDIYGFSQQQSGDASFTFSSQCGTVRVDSLPRVGGAEEIRASAPETASYTAHQPAAPSFSAQQPAAAQPPAQSGGLNPGQSGAANIDPSSILTLLEQLGQLKEKGILTEEEFAAKKADLLKRL